MPFQKAINGEVVSRAHALCGIMEPLLSFADHNEVVGVPQTVYMCTL